MPHRTRIMGVLNVTPDSFSDGGQYVALEAAVEQAEELASDGADMIDVGGESTRPGADDVPEAEEIRRVVPVIERIASLRVDVSVDTRKSAVARAALDAGATIINDVSGGAYDPGILDLAAERDVTLVLMHMRGTPKSMDGEADYDDVVQDVRSELAARVDAAIDAGVKRARIWIDPGLGFAKTAEQSIEILRRIDELQDLGLPLVVAPSRKRFVGHVLGTPVDDRLEGTLGAVAWCAMHRVDVVRVHDAKPARRVVEMIAAIQGARGSSEPKGEG